jgi:hypothetical protein
MDPAKKKAFDFNQKLAGISDSIHRKGTIIAMEVQNAMQNHDFSKTKAACEDLGNFIDEQIPELTATPNTGGSENLKKEMLNFLTFEKQMMREGFGPFLHMDSNTSDSVVNAAIQEIVKRSEEENKYLQRVQEAQREFAKQNGLKLKEK